MICIARYNSKSGKGFATVILIIILALVLCVLIMVGMIFQDDNTDKYNSSPSIEPVQDIALNTLLSNEAVISENDLNSVLAYLIQPADSGGIMGDAAPLNAVYLDLGEDTSRLYFQVDFSGRAIGISADADICLDSNGTINIKLENAAAGKLKIPRSLLVYALKQTGLSSSQYISIDETTVSIPSYYSVTAADIGTLVDIDILDLSISDDALYIQTNPIGESVIDNAADILGDRIGSYIDEFGDLF